MRSYRDEKSAGGSAATGGLSFEFVEADKEILCGIGDKTRQRRQQIADIFLGAKLLTASPIQSVVFSTRASFGHWV